MIEAADFIHTAKGFGFELYSGVPCSYLKPLINFVIDSPDIHYIGAANEGDAVAIVSGAELAGKRGVVMFQNSGFGNAINPLTSLNAIFYIPALLICTWRGEPPAYPVSSRIKAAREEGSIPDTASVWEGEQLPASPELTPTQAPFNSASSFYETPSGKAARGGGSKSGFADLEGATQAPFIDEPQHTLMGEITPELFDLLNIPWDFFPETVEDIEPILQSAVKYMDDTGLPFGLIMRKDSVRPYKLNAQEPLPVQTSYSIFPAPPQTQNMSRDEALSVVQVHARPHDAVIATTGYTGRALYAMQDQPNQFYMIGSMGCASSIGLGLAWALPERRVIIVDGDGALLMRLGALTTIAHEAPKNLVHILLDNQMHESTGGQRTASRVDFGAIARGCGYRRVVRATSTRELAEAIDASGNELTFIHAKTSAIQGQKLPRPKENPTYLANRFREWLANP
ncbi:MAG TPA: thiamine pyrophosphate-dependent enzyme [Patescibacteria group bacterium]|nr:thiamine pyrophosphate-dependent enzyme [Patescibacteria group bacterium]